MGSKSCFGDILRSNWESVGALADRLLTGGRVLIVAPHPDDEVLGCGGMLLHYQRQEVAISIVYLTDGRYGSTRSGDERRKAEALSVKASVPQVFQEFHDLEDSTLHLRSDQVTDILSRALETHAPDVVFTPWPFDHHQDHRTATACLAEALTAYHRDCIIACYEIMTPLLNGYSVDITRYFEKKNELIELYASQLTLYNLKDIVNSLNRYRGALCRREHVKAAECFFLATSNMLSQLRVHVG